jgi:hypothetical protein
MDFYKRYADAFHLPEPSPFEAPSKPLRSQEQEQEQEQDQEQDTPKAPKGARVPFAPPSVSEVQEFCKANAYDISVDAWFAYYEANGWKVGRNPMKSWQGAVRTWVHNGYASTPAKQKGIPQL